MPLTRGRWNVSSRIPYTAHSFSTAKPTDESYAAILDLERVVPCVEGGSVAESIGPDSVKAEIKIGWARCR